MSPELDYWKRISKCEVPGLELHFQENRELDYWHCTVKYGGEWTLVDDEPHNSPHTHRSAAMLVVDALEAARLALFGRIPDRVDSDDGEVTDIVWEAHTAHRLFMERHLDHGGKEHLALLSLLADVCEAL